MSGHSNSPSNGPVTRRRLADMGGQAKFGAHGAGGPETATMRQIPRTRCQCCLKWVQLGPAHNNGHRRPVATGLRRETGGDKPC